MNMAAIRQVESAACICNTLFMGGACVESGWRERERNCSCNLILEFCNLNEATVLYGVDGVGRPNLGYLTAVLAFRDSCVAAVK